MSATLEALISFIRETHTLEEIVGGVGIVKLICQVEDLTTASGIEPSTLALSAGIMLTTVDELDELIDALTAADAAGLIITMNLTPTRKTLPVYRMKNSTKLPRLIYETTRFLIKSESKELTITRAMKSLLSGSAQNESALRYLEQHGFPAMARYYLLVSDSGKEELPHSCSFKFEGNFLTVICTSERGVCIDAANELSGEVGISEFSSPDELPVAYKRALSAKRTARLSGKKLIFYGEDGIYGLMRSVSETQEAIDFSKRILDPIIEYDAKNHSDYLETLRVYLSSDGSVQETSERLGIHRNTVNNKIRFIKENFGLSFDYVGIAEMIAALAIDELSKYKKEK